MRKKTNLPILLDEIIEVFKDYQQDFTVYSYTEEDGRFLEAHMSEIAGSIKTHCNEFCNKNYNSKISLYIRVLGDVSIFACSLLTKDINPDVTIDLNVIHKEKGSGIVLYVLTAETIENTKDCTNVPQFESPKSNDTHLQDCLEEMVMDVMGESN